MKHPVRTLIPLTAVVLLAACVKPAEQKAPENTPAPKAEPFAVAPPPPAQPPSVAGIPAAAIGAAERAKMKVEVASTSTADNGALFRQAKALCAEKKFSEARAVLDRIPAELLTPDQEKAVNELRSQINAALGG
ncbi:MAG: hypothetical protein RLZZ50_1201 [Verrucomicrobiota bacterium]